MKTILIILAIVTCMGFTTVVAQEKIGGGDLTFTPKNAKPVLFSHERHVKGGGLKCSGCHYAIFQKEHGSFNMEMSKIKEGEFCGKCHNGQKAFDVKETRNCSRCHKG